MQVARAFVPVAPSGPSSHDPCHCSHAEKNGSGIDECNHEGHLRRPVLVNGPSRDPVAAGVLCDIATGIEVGGALFADALKFARHHAARLTAVGTTSDRSSAGILNLAERARPLHNPDITSFRTPASWAETLLEGHSLASK